MKNLKKIVLTLVVLFIGISLNAQKGQKQADPEKRLAKIAQELDLSDDQIESLKPIFEKYHNQMETLKNAEGDREDKKADRKKLKDAQKEEVSKILTAEQLTKFKEMKKDRKGKKAKKGTRASREN